MTKYFLVVSTSVSNGLTYLGVGTTARLDYLLWDIGKEADRARAGMTKRSAAMMRMMMISYLRNCIL